MTRSRLAAAQCALCATGCATLAALRPAAAVNEFALQALGERMLKLDLEARRFEILNLPRAQLGELPQADHGFGQRVALQRTQQCGRLLREIDLAKPEARVALLRGTEVPDDYSRLGRVLGIYALTRIAFAGSVRRYKAQTLAAFRHGPAAPAGAMRQWGRHATAFIGRRHFDDADLFEKRFIFDLQ